MNREYIWQYLLRRDGRPFGRPRRLSLADVEDQMSRWPTLVAFNTQTGEVVYQ